MNAAEQSRLAAANRLNNLLQITISQQGRQRKTQLAIDVIDGIADHVLEVLKCRSLTDLPPRKDPA